MRNYKKMLSWLLVCMLTITSLAVPSGINAAPSQINEDITMPVFGDVNRNEEIDISDVLMVQKSIAQISVFSTQEKMLADLDGNASVDLLDVIMLQRYIAHMITSFPVGDQEKSMLSRQMWIYYLVDKAGLPESSFTDSFYIDIENVACHSQIQSAAEMGIIDKSENMMFYPDEDADRDFVSYTFSRVMGFCDNNDLECADLNAVLHKAEAATALNNQCFRLVNNMFLPDQGVNYAEAYHVLQIIDEIYAATEIDADYKNEVVLDEGVYVADNDLEYEVSDDSIIVDNSLPDLDDLSVGKVVVLPSENEYDTPSAYKIVEIQQSDDGKTVLTTTEPELDEVYDRIDAQGSNLGQIEEITPLCEGLTYNFIPDGENKNARNTISEDSTGKNIIGGGTIPVNAGTLELVGKDIHIGGTTANLKASIKNPVVRYRCDISLFDSWTKVLDIKDLYFAVDLDASVELEVSGKNDAQSIPLCTTYIPLGNTGLYVDIIFSAETSIDGSCKISWNYGVTQGTHIINNQPRKISGIYKKGKDVSAQVTLKAGVGLSANLMAFKWCLADVKGESGVKVNANIKTYLNNPTVCCEVNVYAYLNISVGKKGLLKKLGLTADWKIYHSGNSPIRLNYHFENGVLVPNCTVLQGMNTVYFEVPDDWGDKIYAYYWTGSIKDETLDEFEPWPGVEMTHMTERIYTVNVPNKYNQIIFSVGTNRLQTLDLTIQGNNYIFVTNGTTGSNSSYGYIGHGGSWKKYN